MSNRSDRGEALWPYLAVIALFAFIFMCKSPMGGGDFPVGYPNIVEGPILSEPSTRWAAGGNQKVSLTIGVDTKSLPSILLPAHSQGELIVECASTRCTQIKQYEVHRLVCRVDGRWFEPNVVLCKHKKKVRSAPDT